MLKACRPLVALLLVQAALAAAPRPAMAEADGLSVRDAWARAPAVPGRNGAAFLTMVNKGESVRSLVGAETPAAERVELHRSVMEDGVMKMIPQDAIPVPPGGATVLEPGGLHLMLIQAKPQVKAGRSIELTLHFRNADSRSLRARVVAPGRTPDMAE